MPLSNYGVLRGHVSAVALETDDPRSPHVHVRIVAADQEYVASVNVKSRAGLTERDKWLLFYVSANFHHPVTADLPRLAPGFHRLPTADLRGLDYVRQNLVRRETMRALPPEAAGSDEDDLNDALHFYLTQGRRRRADCYVFGQAVPGSDGRLVGMHDIHLNQGNDAQGPYAPTNGIFQDGALLLHHSTGRWVALLLAFQAQTWHTDDTTGHPLTSAVPARLRVPDGAVRIIAARLPTPHQPATVTLLNASASPIVLDGWVLRNSWRERTSLAGTLPPGEARTFALGAHLTPLNARGGYLSVLDEHDWKVDGVSYLAARVGAGGVIVF